MENGPPGMRYIIADFYCTEYRIAIEVDGGSHIGKEQKDAERDAMLRSNGINILRIWNQDVFESDAWLKKLRDMIANPDSF